MGTRSIVDVMVHVVWATWSRRLTLSPSDDARLARLVHGSARRVGCDVIAIGNASDHVHVIVQVAPMTAIAALVQRMKGVSSYLGGWRWQAGYYASSLSAADLGPLADYVERQRDRHDDSHPAEHWILAHHASEP